MSAQLLRQLPSISELLLEVGDLVADEGHARVVDALRLALNAARESISKGAPSFSRSALIAQAREYLAMTGALLASTQVINATGVILHTNLGRAVLSNSAQKAMAAVAAGYSPLEYDLATGERGQRGHEVERLVCKVTGSQGALVVNNCAAATVLMLSATARGRAVVISRGELVEIGGGFRIPEILEHSHARLVEVGTTNRTRPSDYEQALASGQDVAAILRVHSSNFRIVGFTESVPLTTLVQIAGARLTQTADEINQRSLREVLVLDDIGSGALIDTCLFGLLHEPMPQESVRDGAALVAFSGDKLVGGPQAGILAGRLDLIERCRLHPLARAFRADKFTLASLGATLLHYIRDEAVREVPVWRMISCSVSDIERRADWCINAVSSWLEAHGVRAELVDGRSTVGGGTLPGETLPTKLIALHGRQEAQLARDLRAASMPIVARIQDNTVMLDMRTVLDDNALVASIHSVGMTTN